MDPKVGRRHSAPGTQVYRGPPPEQGEAGSPAFGLGKAWSGATLLC